MKFRTYFVLRGDNEHLARGELRALLEVFNAPLEVECYPMLCLSDCPEETSVRVVERAGFIKEAGRLVGVYDAYSNDLAHEVRSTLGSVVHVSVYKSSVSTEFLADFTERAGFRLGVAREGEKRLIFTGGIAVAGVKLAEQDTKSMLERSRMLPFKRSISLTPDVARALVNLSRAGRGDLLLDPFAGTGVVLVEAWSMGIRGVAVDIDWELVQGMVLNFRSQSTLAIPVLGDSTVITYREVDHVATDLPYGRGASTHGVEAKELYRVFIERLSEYLSSRGYASFMTPLWMEDAVDDLLSDYGFRIYGRYYDYVHGSLTRVINVVVKK